MKTLLLSLLLNTAPIDTAVIRVDTVAFVTVKKVDKYYYVSFKHRTDQNTKLLIEMIMETLKNIYKEEDAQPIINNKKTD